MGLLSKLKDNPQVQKALEKAKDPEFQAKVKAKAKETIDKQRKDD
jgi:hypothetical protein